MSEVTFTPEQKSVIQEGVKNILVSAAAGSGKTTVLVERIIQKILEDDTDYSIDKILVMTFTKEAAHNMSRKIASAIKAKIKELSVDYDKNKALINKLKNQIDKLPNCYIQTIDSFCSRVIREKSYVIADSSEAKLLEQGSTILSNQELDLILTQSAEDAIKDAFDGEGEALDNFEDLSYVFGDGRNEKGLAECLVTVYKKLRSIPEHLKKCDILIEDREEQDANGEIVGLDAIIDRLMDVYRLVDDQYADELIDIAQHVKFMAKPQQNEDRKDDFCTLIRAMCKYAKKIVDAYGRGVSSLEILSMIRSGADEVIAEVGKINKLPSVSEDKNTDEENSYIESFRVGMGPIGALILLLKSRMVSGNMPGGLKGYYDPFYPGDDYKTVIEGDDNRFIELQKRRTTLIKEFVKLLKSVDKYYALNKARVHGMDFADQEHLALEILKVPEASEFYKDKFIEIYIDEYQDNSELQDKIIEQIKSAAGNVFRVGDVKQSIYKFRYAKPSMFLEIKSKYEHDESEGKLFLLNQNHRSSAEILDFCNCIFGQLMSGNATEINYDESHMLKYEESKRTGVLPRIRVVNNYGRAKSSSDSSGEIELFDSGFAAILDEVKRFAAAGCKGNNVCILTRSRNAASRISNYLTEHEYPAKYADSLDIFGDNDISGIVNVIIALGNELRDEYLLGILLSGYRISNFTLDEIAAIQIFAMNHQPSFASVNLIRKLQLFASEHEADNELGDRVNAFLDWFGELRHNLLLTDIGDVIENIYRNTGVIAVPENRYKLSLFKDWLCSNFLRYGSDIAGIAGKLEDMKIKLNDKSGVRVETENSDEIQCMTIHASKGLEFEGVIVTDIDSVPSKDSERLVYSDSLGFVIDDTDTANASYCKSIERIRRDESEVLAGVSEDIRLLYVALTRPKKYLSVVTSMNLDKESSGNDNKKARMYVDLMRQRKEAISRQFWINNTSSLGQTLLSGVLRLDNANELRSRISRSYNKGEEPDVAVNIHFDGLEIVIDDDSDKDEKSVYNESSVGDENQVIERANRADSTPKLKLESIGTDDNGMPIFKPYRHQTATTIPFKMTVSQIKSGGVRESVGLPLRINKLKLYRDKYSGIVGETAAEIGTFVHKLLRFIDLNKVAEDEANFDAQITELADEGILSKVEIERVVDFKDDIIKWSKTDLAERLIKADSKMEAEYEKPIIFSTPVDEYSAMVQGVIDCIFYEEDGAVIIDYKTDAMDDADSAEERAEQTRKKHSKQIACYAEAIKASGIDVKEKYIVLLRFGEIIKIG